MWGHLEFIMHEAPNWTAARQIDVHSKTVLQVTLRENRVSCSILIHSLCQWHCRMCGKVGYKSRCIPNEIWWRWQQL